MASDRDDDKDKDARRGEDGGGPFVTEAIRKLFTAGVSAAFLTEESIRGFVSELKLPKETVNMLLQGASKSKEELMNRVSREVISIISKIDFVKEASRFVEEHKFRINAEIEVIRKEPTPSPSASPGGESESTVEIRMEEPGDVEGAGEKAGRPKPGPKSR
jgi:hypothetical protein